MNRMIATDDGSRVYVRALADGGVELQLGDDDPLDDAVKAKRACLTWDEARQIYYWLQQELNLNVLTPRPCPRCYAPMARTDDEWCARCVARHEAKGAR